VGYRNCHAIDNGREINEIGGCTVRIWDALDSLFVLLTFNIYRLILLLMGNTNELHTEVPYGTLDLMVLKTLDTLGPLHGYGIARRIEQVSQGGLALNQGTIYPALLRLEQRGWIKSGWGTSENNRRARFYSISAAGRKQLAAKAENWSRTVAMVNRLLEGES